MAYDPKRSRSRMSKGVAMKTDERTYTSPTWHTLAD
jgi:hypothetical protein